MSAFIKFFQLYLFVFYTLKISSKLIEPEYNNGNVQDPNLDKSYSDINGINL